jgi:hypothetical protein
LLKEWVGNRLNVPFALLCAIAVLSVSDALGNSFAMFLNGVGELRSQLVVVVPFCVIALSLKLWLVSTFGEVAWVVWSTVIASVVSYTFYLGLFRKRIFAHTVAPGERGTSSA